MAKVLGHVIVEVYDKPKSESPTNALRYLGELVSEGERLPFPFVESGDCVYNGGNFLAIADCKNNVPIKPREMEILNLDFPKFYGTTAKEFYQMIKKVKIERKKMNDIYEQFKKETSTKIFKK